MGKEKSFRFRLSTQLFERLQKKQEQTGAPISEIVRRAILQYLDKKDSE